MKGTSGGGPPSCKNVRLTIPGHKTVSFKRVSKNGKSTNNPHTDVTKMFTLTNFTNLNELNLAARQSTLTNTTKQNMQTTMKNHNETITDDTNDTQMLVEASTSSNNDENDGFLHPRKFVKISGSKRTEPVNEVKTKNKFTPLTFTTEIDDSNTQQTTPIPTDETKQPPIFFRGLVIKELNNFISKKLDHPITIRIGAEYNSLKPKTYKDRQTILTEFTKAKVEHYTYQISAQKPRKVVVKHIPQDVTDDEIKHDLEMQGIQIQKVARLTNRHGQTTNIVQLTVDKTELDKVYKITKIYNLYVKIETYKRRTGPTQCYNCQQLGHSSFTCGMPPKCVKCGQEHKTADCTKTTDEKATCANCGGGHTANYKGCQCHKDARKAQQTKPKQPKQNFRLTHDQFPTLPNSTQQTQQQTPTWGPTQKEDNDGSLSDILALLKSFNLKEMFSKIKAAMGKIKAAKTSFEKVLVIAEALIEFF